MTNTKAEAARPAGLGDAAVDGMLNGVMAGIFMALFLALATLAAGKVPWSVLETFDATGKSSPVMGLVLHLAVSAVYGTIFGLLWKLLRPALAGRIPSWLAGAAFGLALFAMAEFVLLPGARTGLRDIPTLVFGAAHLIYGLVLGGLLARLI